MGNAEAKASSRKPGWRAALFFAWLAGALVLQAPFQFERKLGNGNLGYNIVLSVALLVLGVAAVVGLTHLFRSFVRKTPREPSLRRWTLGLHAAACLFFAAAFLPALPYQLFWGGLAALGTWAIVSVVHSAVAVGDRRGSRLSRGLRARIARKSWRFNGAYWLPVFLLLLTRDLWSFGEIEGQNALETVVILSGRFLTLATLTVGLVLIVQAMLALFPVGLRWIVIAAAAFIPLVIVADFAAGLYWQQSLLQIVNSFTLTGRFDMKQQLEGGGIKNSPFEVFFLLVVMTAGVMAAYYGLQKVSNRFGSRTGTVRALLIVSLLWIGAIGQQALSRLALRKEIWQAEHAAFKVHLGVLGPDPGLETIPVRIVETQGETESEELLAGSVPGLARMPDIYIVVVETWRTDAITPEISPFLHRFREEECQQFDVTYAGSNCTPISWFTLFHSRLGIHWKQAVAEKSSPGGLRGAYPVRLLHKLGYSCSVRAVCDLGYQEMSDLNFGANHRLAEKFLDNPMLPRGLEIPEREIIVIDDLKTQLESTSPGSHLHFLSLDSPHYNYYWPENGFEPIHHDCAGNINYASLKPSREAIREVVKRYENSAHWIDQELAAFIAYLKSRNRYENSIIVLTGDHGEEFQEHGSWFHCSNLKNPQTKVPIMIKWPAWVENQPPQALVTHLDVMPSVLDALGLEEKYFENLAGRSLLRPHPGESVLATNWAGTTGVGVCFLKDGLKANFAVKGLWKGGVPTTLYFIGYTDLDDQPLDPLKIRGDRPHSEVLRQKFSDVTARHFNQFGN